MVLSIGSLVFLVVFARWIVFMFVFGESQQISSRFPSRVFEAAVNHRSIIVSATKGFYGSVSDKSIVKFNGIMMAMK